MKRAIDSYGNEHEVYEVYACLQGWEWFVVEKPNGDDLRYGFVQSPLCPDGEFGSFSLSEIRKSVKLSGGKCFNGCLPPQGWRWL